MAPREEEVPLVRLLSMAVTVGLEELHDELARRGHADLRPVHGYALNAVLNGHDTATQMAPHLGMTKQGAARLVDHLVARGYLAYGGGAGGDARRKPLELTAQGRAVVELSVRLQRQLEVRWAELAGARHVAAMRRVLEKVVMDERTIAPPVRMSVPSPLQRRGSG